MFFCAGGLMVEHPLVEPHITYMHGVPTYCSIAAVHLSHSPDV